MSENLTENERSLFQRGVQWLSSSVSLQIKDPHVWIAVGVAYSTNGFGQHAITCFDVADRLSPGLTATHYNRGVHLRRVGLNREAIRAFECAQRTCRSDPDISYNLGNSYKDIGNLAAAIESYRRTLELNPRHERALINKALCHQEMQHDDAAIKLLRNALERNPANPRAHLAIGVSHARVCDYDVAIAHFSKAIRLGSNAAWSCFAQTVSAGGNLDANLLEALHEVVIDDYLEEFISCQSNLFESGRIEECISLSKALSAGKPNDLRYSVTYALALFSTGDVGTAKDVLTKAYAIWNTNFDILNNLSLVSYVIGDLGSSLRYARLATRIEPANPTAQLNLAAVQLAIDANDSDAWHRYEWRKLCPKLNIRSFESPQWCGQHASGLTILACAEQGLGDTFQFMRYLILLARDCHKLVLLCPRVLVPLLSQCGLAIELIPDDTKAVPHHDYHVHLASLPGIYRESTSKLIPYVSPENKKVEQWREKVNAHPGMKIGLAWQGNPKYPLDIYRSCGEHPMQILTAIEECTFFQLQFEPAAKLEIVSFEEVDVDGAFVDTSAIIAALDLVITSDTAIAHLAGAMGIPCWVALSVGADWRWFPKSESTRWYPATRLFRQQRINDWTTVFEKMKESLLETMSKGGDPFTSCEGNEGTERYTVEIPVSTGELIDKFTILLIKESKATAPTQVKSISIEIECLEPHVRLLVDQTPDLAPAKQTLQAINEQLWDVEDRIRECEARGVFSEEFIKLARSVYRLNDERAELKSQINEMTGSYIRETKIYARYTD